MRSNTDAKVSARGPPYFVSTERARRAQRARRGALHSARAEGRDSWHPEIEAVAAPGREIGAARDSSPAQPPAACVSSRVAPEAKRRAGGDDDGERCAPRPWPNNGRQLVKIMRAAQCSDWRQREACVRAAGADDRWRLSVRYGTGSWLGVTGCAAARPPDHCVQTSVPGRLAPPPWAPAPVACRRRS